MKTYFLPVKLLRTLIKLSATDLTIITTATVIAPVIIMIAPEAKNIISVMVSKVILLHNCLNYFVFVNTSCRRSYQLCYEL